MNTKRLYVGGLSHTISEKDLKDRFGKFGEVSDVEVVSRKDEDGSPLKTFGYINISLTDAEFKRCMTVLNKSKWKGGLLQIEMAKESFLHRLAVERQQASENAKAETLSHPKKLVESLKKVGVENFHMKAAVPGTEVPEHKDWIVSKFGRVLPILNLKCEGKRKILKYDPSKHCHNIKKLEPAMELAPVSQLTWELPGGDDEISKKRRGEFPPQKTKPKKIKQDLSCALGTYKSEGPNNPTGKLKCLPLESKWTLACGIEMEGTKETDDELEVVKDDFIIKSSVSQYRKRKDPTSLNVDDDDYSSADTDEILTRNKAEDAPHVELNTHPKPGLLTEDGEESDGNLESDGSIESDYEDGEESDGNLESDGSIESDYEDGEESDGNLESDSSIESDYEAMMTDCCRLEISLEDLKVLANRSSENSEIEGEKLPVQSPKKKCINPEDILASILGNSSEDESPVKKPKVKKSKKKSLASLPAFRGTKSLFGVPTATEQEGNDCMSVPTATEQEGNDGMSVPTATEQEGNDGMSVPTATEQEGNDGMSVPTATEQEGNDGMSVQNIGKEQKTVSKLNSCCSEIQDEICHDLATEPLKSREEDLATEPLKSREEDFEEDVGMTHSTLHCRTSSENLKLNLAEDFSSTHDKNRLFKCVMSSCEDLKTDLQNSNCSILKETTVEQSTSSSSDEGGDQSKPEVTLSKDEDKKSTEPKQSSVPVYTCDIEKQKQDNERRLAALQQRQKESAQQKRLIQGALAVVDTQNAHRGKHIVFDSDNEGDVEEDAIRGNILLGGESEDIGIKNQKQQPKPSGTCKLFDSSEEEDESSDEALFQIKPQFEGKTGRKLMELQSRFGADQRFQMDSRFMESEEEDEEELKNSDVAACTKGNVSNVIEEEIVEEKRKNLEILQSVLNISKKPGLAENTKSKIFRDISSLHYDPSREDHAAFEKSKVTTNDGKATRRKKLAEAEKLPEVSKDIFYDVAVDLKEVFGSASHAGKGEKDVSWDKQEEAAKESNDQTQPAEGDTDVQWGLFSLAAPEKDESTGFQFSFFGADPKTLTNANAERDEYKIELLKGPKVSWQVNPHFQDSSSDEDDDDGAAANEEENKTASVVAVEHLKPSKGKLFFFYQDDDRLKEGPRLFCRPTRLEDQKEEWEQRRSSLIEEYRKKHRAARKKLRESHRN